MIGFHGIGILFHGICISFRCISLHFMNFVTFRFMSSKRYFATDGAPYAGQYTCVGKDVFGRPESSGILTVQGMSIMVVNS